MRRSEDSISDVVEGHDVNTTLDAMLEVANPIPVRKRIRSTAPNLYQWLSSNGVLHDFALDVASGMKEPRKLKQKYDVPLSMMASLGAVLGV